MLNLKDIQRIVDTYNDDTLTLYLRVDPSYIENQSQTPAWTIWLKNALKDIKNSLNDSQKSVWKNIETRLNDYLNSYKPSGRTIVIFMNQQQDTIHELPFAMKNRSQFGEPLVSPLLWAMDEYERYLIVMVDQQKAILHKAYLGNLETESEMTIDLDYDWVEKTLMPATDGDGQALRQGNNRDAFDDMITEHVNRFHSDVADEVQTIFNGDQPMRLILAGDEKSAHALKDKLHESVTKQFVSILPIPIDTSVNEVMERISQPAYNYERDYEFDLVEDVSNKAHADGRGVLGRDDLERAMQMQQVELIIMPFSLLQDDPEYAHDLAMWSLENNSEIEFVHGQAARKLEASGGIAARLYYSIEAV